MAFKLPGFGGKKTNIKGDMDRKYGHGDYARGGKKFEERMKPGESKFNYDVRMRKAKRSTESTSSTRSSSTYKEPDPKSEINVKQDKTLPYDYQPQERNPGDLRESRMVGDTLLPSAPGDPYKYEVDFETGEVAYIDPEGNWGFPELGSTEDRAIRKRYTGSETGDLSDWHGYDTYTNLAMQPEDIKKSMKPVTGTGIHEKAYLPYDLAQKKDNPKYKGSKK